MDHKTHHNPHFSPDWDDSSVLLPETLYLPLLLPPERPNSADSSLWVVKKRVSTEEWRNREIVLEFPRTVTMVMRKSEKGKDSGIHFANRAGVPVSEDVNEAFYHLLFPPRVWMCDSLQEMSMMFLAAKEAKGKVLVGGLGLGIYPQLAMLKKRPLTSITIVEINPDMIRLVEPFVQQCAQKHGVPVRVVPDSIENFMETTDERFDTIYLDTWGDLHFKFLGYINHLIWLASKIATPKGKIQCWGYNFLYKEFIKLALHLEKEPNFDLGESEVEENPCLKAYLAWRRGLVTVPKLETVQVRAAQFAVETKDSTYTPLYIDEVRSPLLQEILSRKGK